MFKFFIACIIGYFLLRFVTRFLLPVIRVTRNTAQGMRAMQDQMERMQAGKASEPVPAKPSQAKPSAKPGDYIDYEEVR